MNEKERIIELVKQNVISMEEALDLLEAASKNETTSKVTEEDTTTESTEATNEEVEFNKTIDDVINQGKKLAKNLGQYINKETEKAEKHHEKVQETTQEPVNMERIVEIDREIQALNEEFDKRNEALIICNQRLREVEIFEELDDLTPEMVTQKSSLQDKKLQIEDKLNDIQTKINTLNEEKVSLGWTEQSHKSEFKDFFNSSSEKITEAASHIGKEASREGKKWGSFITEQSKSLLENFNLKDVNVSFQVPWVKTATEDYTFTYPAEDVEELEIDLYNGSVDVVTYDGEDIVVEANVRFYGKHSEVSEEAFKAANMIEVINQRLVMNINSAKYSMDGLIKVPKGDFKRLQMNLLNGDINLSNLNIEETTVKNKNGDVSLKDVSSQEASFDLLNGDITIIDSPIETIVINDLNGDVKINGYIQNVSAETLNSDFFLTKKDLTDANIKVKTVSGDVKLSLPKSLNLTLDSKTTNGEIKNRLSNLESIDESESKSKARYHRIVSGEVANAVVTIGTTSGDIYLKDSKKSI